MNWRARRQFARAWPVVLLDDPNHALRRRRRRLGGRDAEVSIKTKNEETTNKSKEIREKLQQFHAKIPVFMCTKNFREESRKHVIESLGAELFERVTGLTVGTSGR